MKNKSCNAKDSSTFVMPRTGYTCDIPVGRAILALVKRQCHRGGRLYPIAVSSDRLLPRCMLRFMISQDYQIPSTFYCNSNEVLIHLPKYRFLSYTAYMFSYKSISTFLIFLMSGYFSSISSQEFLSGVLKN